MSFVIVMVLLLVVMYVLMIRPQRQRQADQKRTIDTAGVGDDVLTTGGIYGTITAAEGDDVVVEIAEGLNVHMTRRAIAAVLPPEDEEQEEDEEGEDEEGDGEAHGEDAESDDEHDHEHDHEASVSDDDAASGSAEVGGGRSAADAVDEGAVAPGEEPVRTDAGDGATPENRL